MRKIYMLLAATAALCVSCEEFEPVFTFKYDDPQSYSQSGQGNVVKPGEITANTTIADLASMYKNGKPMEITDDVIIAGRVVTTDKPGNFYKSLYIQDETGAIELKIGRNSLYNDYALGQLVYVKCGPVIDKATGYKTQKGLFLGSYGYKSGNYGGNGMVQLGCEDPTGEYETSYMELEYIVNSHIFRVAGDVKPQEPVVITESQLPSANAIPATCPYLGKYVTVQGLRYGGADYPAGEVFALLYINGNESNKNSKNRVFLSDGTWNVTTWAMSKTNFLGHLRAGDWDAALVGNSGDNNYGTVGRANLDYVKETDPVFIENVKNDPSFQTMVNKWVFGSDAKNKWVTDPDQLQYLWVRYCLAKNANGYSVSQYFLMGGTEIQLRTSGYSKFCDAEIPAEVLNGTATVDLTGILTLYQGSIQFVVNSLEDIKINK